MPSEVHISLILLEQLCILIHAVGIDTALHLVRVTAVDGVVTEGNQPLDLLLVLLQIPLHNIENRTSISHRVLIPIHILLRVEGQEDLLPYFEGVEVVAGVIVVGGDECLLEELVGVLSVVVAWGHHEGDPGGELFYSF